MDEKKDRFAKDLDRLIKKGEKLSLAIRYETCKDAFLDQISKVIEEKKLDDFLKSLPDFRGDYQAWYSEALGLVKQILPDRLSDFKSYYEYPRVRKEITYDN